MVMYKKFLFKIFENLSSLIYFCKLWILFNLCKWFFWFWGKLYMKFGREVDYLEKLVFFFCK